MLLDVDGDGFKLTDLYSGVLFPIGPTEVRYQVNWTRPGSDDAWLALDRNLNGRIDNGLELFGNSTEQSLPAKGEQRHGVRALAEFDKPEHGGNADGVIDGDDPVFKWAVHRFEYSDLT